MRLHTKQDSVLLQDKVKRVLLFISNNLLWLLEIKIDNNFESHIFIIDFFIDFITRMFQTFCLFILQNNILIGKISY